MRLTVITKSTAPAVIALIGIDGQAALLGFWAKVTPPAALMAFSPRVPSEPVPESSTPIEAGPCCSASAVKKSSIGCRRRASDPGVSLSTPWPSVIRLLGGITYTQLGSTLIASPASTTGIAVAFDKIAARALSCVGSKCWIRTKAMPGLAGRVLRSDVNAASPPAEAPIDTIGKLLVAPT